MAASVAVTRNPNEDKPKEEIQERKPLPYLFEKELVSKQAKHFWLVDEFIPIAVGRKIKTFEKKISARHEQILPNQYEERFLRCTDLDKRTTNLGLPRLESQAYGWLPSNLNHSDKCMGELNFIRAPKLRCDLTIYGEHFISGRITERPGFNGLRFFLR